MADSTGKYLITDKNERYYTVADDGQTIVELDVEKLDADTFMEHGMDSMPGAELLMQIPDSGFLYYQESDTDVPQFAIRLEAVPFNQTVVTQDINISHESIIGIERIEAECDENMLFAVSVDEGQTWLNYINGGWGVLSEETSGMTASAMKEIPTDAWAQIMTTGHFRIRFLLTENGYFRSLVVRYINTEV